MLETKFSVLINVYAEDNPEWFEIAIKSILNQTIIPNEIVVVVDGPVPIELEKIIEKYKDNSLFHIIRLSKNKGLGIARKIGLNACINELVALMDADDISVSDRFEKQLYLFKSNTLLDIVGGNITEFIDDECNIVSKRMVPSADIDIKEYMKIRCPMNHVTVMFKKSSVEKVGGYLDWFCNEDYYLWIRMALANMKFANSPDILVNVRVGKDMYNRRGGIKYFSSEAKLQKFMLENNFIDIGTYFTNLFKRFIVQVLLPNSLRGYVYKKFARN